MQKRRYIIRSHIYCNPGIDEDGDGCGVIEAGTGEHRGVNGARSRR